MSAVRVRVLKSGVNLYTCHSGAGVMLVKKEIHSCTREAGQIRAESSEVVGRRKRRRTSYISYPVVHYMNQVVHR